MCTRKPTIELCEIISFFGSMALVLRAQDWTVAILRSELLKGETYVSSSGTRCKTRRIEV